MGMLREIVLYKSNVVGEVREGCTVHEIMRLTASENVKSSLTLPIYCTVQILHAENVSLALYCTKEEFRKMPRAGYGVLTVPESVKERVQELAKILEKQIVPTLWVLSEWKNFRSNRLYLHFKCCF